MLPLSPRRLLLGIATPLVLLAYLLLAPTSFGGPITYLKVFGTSMTPSFAAGDLVLARSAATYHVGDVVVYHNPDLGLVVHRVVALDHDRLVMQGDANSWTDSYHPLPSEIAGKLWLRLPGFGRYISWLGPPWGTLALLLPALAAVGLTALRRGPRRPHPSPDGGPPRPRRRQPLTMYSPTGAALSLLCVTLATAAAIAGIVAYRHPLTTSVSAPLAYEQQGTFSYSALAPPDIYQTDALRSGEPAFVRITGDLHVTFDYHFTSDALHDPAGTARMTAVLSQTNGWQRELPITEDTAFHGSAVTLSGAINLRALRALIDEVEGASGAHYETYQLEIVPEVQVRNGASPLTPFTPRLPFRFSSTELQLVRHDGQAVPLTFTTDDALPRSVPAPATVSLMGVRVSIDTMRAWTPLAGLAALAGLLLLGWLTRRSHGDEAQRIEAQYGTLVTIAQMLRRPDRTPLIAVQHFEELAEIAQAQGLPVIRDADDLDQYFVITRDGTFAYRTAGVPTALRDHPQAPRAA